MCGVWRARHDHRDVDVPHFGHRALDSGCNRIAAVNRSHAVVGGRTRPGQRWFGAILWWVFNIGVEDGHQVASPATESPRGGEQSCIESARLQQQQFW